MSDIKLFHTQNGAVEQLQSTSVALEKSLQTHIEKHLDIFLGVRFLATEHSTGKTHGGRIDTLGIDENGSPVIIEYKRALNENVINQGLYYLDWLMDHKGEFKLLVLEELGEEVANTIEWSSPRLLCIAGDFTKYDEHAVQQIDRNIELIRYRRYSDSLLLLELVNTAAQQIAEEGTASSNGSGLNDSKNLSKSVATYKTVTDHLNHADADQRDRFEALKAFLLALGDDVQMKTLKYYIAFRRIKNFACVEIHPQAKKISIFVKVDPDSIILEPGFTKDVRKIGHFGTGDLEITAYNDADLEKAKPLLLKSYEAS